MSRSENSGEPLDTKSLAFEYVAGSLSAEEKRLVENTLTSDKTLQQEIQFWEQQLMKIHPNEERQPRAETWNKIAAEIAPPPQITDAPHVSGFDWKAFWQWGSPSIAAIALMLVLFGYEPSIGSKPVPAALSTVTLGTDYVAVLTDANGRAILTTLSALGEKSMRLKWEINKETIKRLENPENHMQLWAISKRDGEVRPITVFANKQVEQFQLSTAQWRLITDADFLLLTEEEAGGSAIDEPSEILLAKGVCVRFSKDKKT